MRLRYPFIIGAPIQSAPFNKISLSLIKEIRKAITSGGILIYPIGNFGPIPGLINPFAQLEGVISVGSASNDGKKLMEFSSRGIPNVKFSGPSVVAPGVDIIGRTHSGIIQFIIEKRNKSHLITKEKYYNQRAVQPSNESFEEIKKNYVVGSGTSQSVELVADIVWKLVNIRFSNKMNCSGKRIREILNDMASPMKGYENHEVGGGFVNMFVFNSYIQKVVNKNDLEPNTKRLWERPITTLETLRRPVPLIWQDNTYGDIKDFTGEGLMSPEEKLEQYFKEKKEKPSSGLDEEIGI